MNFKRHLYRFALACLLAGNLTLSGSEAEPPSEPAFAEGLTVDVQNPTYENGILSTEDGGVIVAPGVRIQAKHMVYTRKVQEGDPVTHVEAEGQLIVNFGHHTFVGDRIFYNFQEQTGTLINGRTSAAPWFIGAKKVELEADGSYVLYEATLSTCESVDAEWQIRTEVARLSGEKNLEANGIQFRFIEVPVLWMPSLKGDLDGLRAPPVKFRVRLGGSGGPRVSLRYHALSWRNWDAFLRLDWRLRHGPGLGLETEYRDDDDHEIFLTRNFVAWDDDRGDNKSWRYSFAGTYDRLSHDGRTSITAKYHKLSDDDMDDDYREDEFDLKASEYTEGRVTHHTRDGIYTAFMRLRLNSFQTIKQELPTLSAIWRPYELGNTGIIGESRTQVGYLDYEFAKKLQKASDFTSVRAEAVQSFYAPIHTGPFVVTPTVGGTSIYYTDGPSGSDEWLSSAFGSLEVNTEAYRVYGDMKHILHPYTKYTYQIHPTVDPDDHYLFDIKDAYYRLNYLTFGLRNLIYLRGDKHLERYLSADLYTNAFFNTASVGTTLPVVYLDVAWHPLSYASLFWNFAWDFQHSEAYRYNILYQWTFSPNLAVSVEYRHRSIYDWRKLDHFDYTMDSWKAEEDLLDSGVSDRRDTYLFHAFYRARPNLSYELRTRHGRRRATEPNYNEYLLSLVTVLRCSWKVRFTYLHRESDDRFSVNITLNKASRDDDHNQPRPVVFY